MDHFYQNIGEDWFTYAPLYKEMVETNSDGAHFVEVGSWKGRSASYMAVEIHNSNKKIKFDCVDTWKGSSDEEFHMNDELVKSDKLYEEFIKNTNSVAHIINPVRMASTEASKLYEDNSLNFVFIDACHTYECVKEDIIHWLPKVKNGGMLSGHDFNSPDVQKAVVESFDQVYHNPYLDIWFYRK